MYLSPEERAIGSENFCAAVGKVRRDLLKKAIKGDVRSGKGLGPLYFHYDAAISEPVRVGLIGAGDEGNVLLGAINPKFIAVKSIADVRPYSVWRAFHGDCYGDDKTRPGLMSVYGWKTESEARKPENVKVYGDYRDLIAHAKEDKIEAVVIALPLHLHAPAAIAAMKAGLHVITETLMAQSVRECKEMARVAKLAKDSKGDGLLLAVGHQRHYNILYDDAVALIGKGLLGELHSIRAQWHRGDLPGSDTWQPPMPKKAKPDDLQANKLDDDRRKWLAALEKLNAEKVKAAGNPEKLADLVKKAAKLDARVQQINAQIADAVDAKKYGYQDVQIKDASGKVVYSGPPIEELIRWRLWNRTGGGLMAELGCHQLDAAMMFIHAMHKATNPNAEMPLPLSVAAGGGRDVFSADRDVDDHVYCTFEFPSPDYRAGDPIDAAKKIGVQYASINGNAFGGYGETLFGTEGTLVLDAEKEAMLYKTHETDLKTVVAATKSNDKQPGVMLKLDGKGDPESAAIGTLGTLPADRGFTEELEHFAWCIRHRSPENLPRCHPKVALADAVTSLVAQSAARKGARVDFQKEWFDIDDDATPEGEKPDVKRNG